MSSTPQRERARDSARQDVRAADGKRETPDRRRRRKVYYATMEEGFYEVDLQSLEVTELYRDDQRQISGERCRQPQDDLVEPASSQPARVSRQRASTRAVSTDLREQRRTVGRSSPATGRSVRLPWPSGTAAAQTGTSCDATSSPKSPGPEASTATRIPKRIPIWSHRLGSPLADPHAARPAARGTTYRLPKASHTYDGAHGWNTEWPRIRDIGEDDLLMTMHGMFWRFPQHFSLATRPGIAPRSDLPESHRRFLPLERSSLSLAAMTRRRANS